MIRIDDLIHPSLQKSSFTDNEEWRELTNSRPVCVVAPEEGHVLSSSGRRRSSLSSVPERHEVEQEGLACNGVNIDSWKENGRLKSSGQSKKKKKSKSKSSRSRRHTEDSPHPPARQLVQAPEEKAAAPPSTVATSQAPEKKAAAPPATVITRTDRRLTPNGSPEFTPSPASTGRSLNTTRFPPLPYHGAKQRSLDPTTPPQYRPRINMHSSFHSLPSRQSSQEMNASLANLHQSLPLLSSPITRKGHSPLMEECKALKPMMNDKASASPTTKQRSFYPPLPFGASPSSMSPNSINESLFSQELTPTKARPKLSSKYQPKEEKSRSTYPPLPLSKPTPLQNTPDIYSNMLKQAKSTRHDAKGKCIHHPNVRLCKKKLFGGWTKVLSSCPECLLEEMQRMKQVPQDQGHTLERKESNEGPYITTTDDGSTGSASTITLSVAPTIHSPGPTAYVARMPYNHNSKQGWYTGPVDGNTGKPNGFGRFVYREGGSFEGVWKDGRCIDDEEEFDDSDSVIPGGVKYTYQRRRKTDPLEPPGEVASRSPRSMSRSSSSRSSSRSQSRSSSRSQSRSSTSNSRSDSRSNPSTNSREPSSKSKPKKSKPYNRSSSMPDNHQRKVVCGMPWSDNSGSGLYTGEVNILDIPDGMGSIRYNNGSVAEGWWKDGEIDTEVAEDWKALEVKLSS